MHHDDSGRSHEALPPLPDPDRLGGPRLVAVDRRSTHLVPARVDGGDIGRHAGATDRPEDEASSPGVDRPGRRASTPRHAVDRGGRGGRAVPVPRPARTRLPNGPLRTCARARRRRAGGSRAAGCVRASARRRSGTGRGRRGLHPAQCGHRRRRRSAGRPRGRVRPPGGRHLRAHHHRDRAGRGTVPSGPTRSSARWSISSVCESATCRTTSSPERWQHIPGPVFATEIIGALALRPEPCPAVGSRSCAASASAPRSGSRRSPPPLTEATNRRRAPAARQDVTVGHMSTELDPSLLRLVRDGMADTVPFARHTGVVLDEVADGSAVASLPATDTILNHVATVHAGALFTLAETAFGRCDGWSARAVVVRDPADRECGEHPLHATGHRTADRCGHARPPRARSPDGVGGGRSGRVRRDRRRQRRAGA